MGDAAVMSALYPISPERYELVLRCLELEREIERLTCLLAAREMASAPIGEPRGRKQVKPGDQAQIRALYQRGLSRPEIERATGWARSTVYRETRDQVRP